jgi:hypothetical protein
MESVIISPITSDISVELGAPPLRIGLGSNGMIRAAMPKATVNKDGDPCSCQGDIWTSRRTLKIDPEAHSSPMQFSPKRQLGSCACRGEA